MKADLAKIRKKRVFSEEFKRNLVKEYESGRFSVLQLEKLHKISNPLLYRWIYKYSTFNDKSVRIVEMSESSTQKIKDLERKIKELERALSQPGNQQASSSSIPQAPADFRQEIQAVFCFHQSF